MGNITVPQVTNEIPNFTPALFDPSNPAIFNFNLEGLNFGSQYGALEFGMLGHMSSGAARTPPKDPSLSQQGSGDATFSSSVYGNGATQFDKVYDGNPMMGDILGLDQNGSGMYSQGNLQHGLPHAYAIAAGPSSLQSPSTENNSPQPTTFGYEGSPTTATYNLTGGSSAPAVAQPRPKTKMATLARIGPQSVLGKRQRDPSYIYETVKEPFPYVSSFHNLIYHIQNRFSKDQSLRIAKALASIRSPLISCMRTLNRRDLVFMEQSFQRALFEYEDFMLQCSSPAIACRRSGELAGVNKEFTALTGWTKEVLLGKEPNLNANTGVSSASGTSSGRAGLTTPKLRSMNPDPSPDRPRQPVFLAELMDDDSVIDFYEDYAHLAFNDSRGKVYRKCRLLKYRTQQAMDAVKPLDETPQKDPRLSILSNRVAKIDGEHGISKLERDGKLECSYTFAIKRDTFDIPMMIIVNVSFLPEKKKTEREKAPRGGTISAISTSFRRPSRLTFDRSFFLATTATITSWLFKAIVSGELFLVTRGTWSALGRMVPKKWVISRRAYRRCFPLEWLLFMGYGGWIYIHTSYLSLLREEMRPPRGTKWAQLWLAS